MGFCRYCGDLIPKELEKCRKCGGVAVKASFAWADKEKSKQGGAGGSIADRWTRTYMTRDDSPPKHEASPGQLATRRAAFEPAQQLSPSIPQTPSKSPTGRRFPLPQNSPLTTSPSAPLHNTRVASHIAAATASPTRTPSVTHTVNSLAASPSGNPIIDDGYKLSKVYGSVLQNPDTLNTYACASCNAVFQRDSTMYPDPNSPTSSPRFLCRDCFMANGGVKADCVECKKPVYKLKKEGDFVENGGRIWHAKCFECESCGRNIARNASVDLMGRPCCAECFDTSLRRSERTRPPATSAHLKEPEGASSGSLGGMLRGKSAEREHESNPAIEELTQRLGIASKDHAPSKRETSVAVASSSSSPTRSRSSSNLPTSASAELEDAITTYSPRSRALNGIRSRKNSEKSRSTSLSGRSSPTQLALDTAASEPPDTTKMTASVPIDGATRSLSHSLITNTLDTITASPVDGNTLATSPIALALRSSTSTIRGLPTSDDRILSTTRNHTPLDSIPSRGRTTFDAKTKSRIPLPRSVALSKGLSDGIGTPELASDGGSESTGSPEASPPTPREGATGSSEAIGDDTPTARRTINSIKTNATGESYGGPSEISEDIDEEEMNTRCTKCNGLLYSLQGGGKIVTVPAAAVGDDTDGVARYHARCFVCAVCQREFSEGREGAAVFVKSDIGITHVQCAPPPKVKIITRPRPSSVSVVQSAITRRQTHYPSASACSVPASKPASSRPRPISALTLSAAATNPLRSIDTPSGTGKECPGCKNGVAMFEPGVVPGPGTTRWHSRCLICGGPEVRRRSKANIDSDPGCGKRLDRDAKVDDSGGVWCNTCFPKIGTGGFHNPLSPTMTGSAIPQVISRYGRSESRTSFIPRYDTGSITAKPSTLPITHHYTGSVLQEITGSSDHSTPGVGGDMGRARSGSATKAMGGAMTVNRKLTRIRPRPKSVATIRLEGLIGEGRGMELIKQMTGSTATESLGDG